MCFSIPLNTSTGVLPDPPCASASQEWNRPDKALSETAGTLCNALPALKSLRAENILGPGIDPLITMLDDVHMALATLNTFGPAAGRSESEVHAAVDTFATTMAKLSPLLTLISRCCFSSGVPHGGRARFYPLVSGGVLLMQQRVIQGENDVAKALVMRLMFAGVRCNHVRRLTHFFCTHCAFCLTCFVCVSSLPMLCLRC
eukprot:2531688-Heterocapsa_arctica.AAC.2